MSAEIEQLLSEATVSFTTLTSKEVEEVADLSGELQRQWRSRGFLKKSAQARVRYDLLDVAAFMVAVPANKYGCSPLEALAFGQKNSRRVLQISLLEVDGAIEVVGPKSTVVRISEQVTKQWIALSERLSGCASLECPKTISSVDFLPLDKADLTPNEGDQRDELSVFTINLVVAGKRLGNRLRRPLVTIALTPTEADNPVIRRVLESRQ